MFRGSAALVERVLQRWSGRAAVAGAVLIVALTVPSAASAQSSIQRLSSECADAGGTELRLSCADGALALQALHGGVGLLMTAGGALPASPSTAGQRIGGYPRVVFDAGASWASFRHPDLSGPSNESATAARSTLVGARVTGVVGVFDGFSPIPAVGGMMSVDAVASLNWARTPSSPASPSSRVGWGGGIRIGLFRESFSLPGLTLSTLYHRAGELEYGTTGGTGVLAAVRPSVTSVRLIAGKDLWPLGVSAGLGWDRYRGEGRIEARLTTGEPGMTPIEVRTSSRDLSMNRRYLFAGVNYTWVITQVALDLTWAGEASPLEDLQGTGPFAAGGSDLQGTLTFRVIY